MSSLKNNSFRGYRSSWVGYIGKMRYFMVTFHPFLQPDKKKKTKIKALYALSAVNKVKKKYRNVCCSVSWK
jgi:hypothetical protein